MTGRVKVLVTILYWPESQQKYNRLTHHISTYLIILTLTQPTNCDFA